MVLDKAYSYKALPLYAIDHASPHVCKHHNQEVYSIQLKTDIALIVASCDIWSCQVPK